MIGRLVGRLVGGDHSPHARSVNFGEDVTASIKICCWSTHSLSTVQPHEHPPTYTINKINPIVIIRLMAVKQNMDEIGWASLKQTHPTSRHSKSFAIAAPAKIS